MPHRYPSKLRLLLSLWLLIGSTLAAHATHIVGGELSLQFLGANQSRSHRITLNLYFDLVNGSADARDQSVRVGIFSKTTNLLIADYALPLSYTALVPYTNSTCGIQTLRTQFINYSVEVALSSAVYTEPGGYYISWERCCRNNQISNISGPGAAGSTFYLEFPALVRDGKAFYNSSPTFRPITGDYACLNAPFSFNFGAGDGDGDSLTYTMVTPYNGFSNNNNSNPSVGTVQLPPTFFPGPYPTVTWNNGSTPDAQIPGNPPLQVNPRTGLLTMTADRTGLFVFSVQVDEFRNGVQIGRVRRDFQLKVVDCPVDIAPKILLKTPGKSGFYRQNDVLTITEADTNCLTLYVTDPDLTQTVTVRNLSGILPGLTISPASITIRTKKDTLITQFCFGRCLARADGKPITLAILASDDACPQGRSDTLYVTLNIITPPNARPVADTDLPGNVATVSVGKSLTFNAFGTDVNNDLINLTATGRGFALASANMNFANTSGTGKVSGPFTWKPACAQGQKNYVVDFVVTDNRCTPLSSTVTVSLTAEALPSQSPTVTTTQSPTVVTVSLPVESGTLGGVQFDVLANDTDSNPITLTGQGRGFDMRAAGATFANKTGSPALRSPFGWTPGCALLQGRDSTTFLLDFSADDGSCSPNHLVTTTVQVNLTSLPIDKTLKMPNVITPNGDGKNDVFSPINLPGENCAEQFQYVEIVNRWGQQVFYSTDHRFAWAAEGFPSGEYFYHLQYSQSSYKGFITLLK